MKITPCEDCVDYENDTGTSMLINNDLTYEEGEVTITLTVNNWSEELHLGGVAIDVMVKQLQKLQLKQQKAIEED